MGSSRREKGTGGYRKLPNGKIQYIKRGEGAVTAVGSTKKEALANAKRKLEKRNLSWSTSRTLEQAWKEMEPELCKQLAPTNSAAYASSLKKVESSFLGKLNPNDVSATDVLRFATQLNVSHITARGHVARVRAILNRLGHKVTVKMPKPPKKEKTTVYGRDADEFMEFVRSLPDNRRIAVGLIYFSGLRRSEACGLRYEDIRGNGAYLSISVTETDDAVHVRPKLKTNESSAYVSLGPEILSWIGKGNGFVLTGTKFPMKPRSLTQLVRRTVAKTKWAKLRPQALRRAHGQLIVERTGNLKLVAGALRHSVAMAAEEYTSVDPTLKDSTHKDVFKPIGSKQSSKRKSK